MSADLCPVCSRRISDHRYEHDYRPTPADQPIGQVHVIDQGRVYIGASATDDRFLTAIVDAATRRCPVRVLTDPEATNTLDLMLHLTGLAALVGLVARFELVGNEPRAVDMFLLAVPATTDRSHGALSAAAPGAAPTPDPPAGVGAPNRLEITR